MSFFVPKSHLMKDLGSYLTPKGTSLQRSVIGWKDLFKLRNQSSSNLICKNTKTNYVSKLYSTGHFCPYWMR